MLSCSPDAQVHLSLVSGMGTMLYFTSGSERFHSSLVGRVFLPINYLLSLNLCVCLIIARLYFPRGNNIRKALQLGSCVTFQTFIFSPMFFRFYDYLILEDPGPLSSVELLGNHSMYVVLNLVCGFFFASLLPELACPGGYDIVGHSHQIFHVVSIFMGLAQIKAGYADLQVQPKHKLEELRPCFLSTFGGFLVLLSFGLGLIFLLRNKMRHIVLKDKDD